MACCLDETTSLRPLCSVKNLPFSKAGPRVWSRDSNSDITLWPLGNTGGSLRWRLFLRKGENTASALLKQFLPGLLLWKLLSLNNHMRAAKVFSSLRQKKRKLWLKVSRLEPGQGQEHDPREQGICRITSSLLSDPNHCLLFSSCLTICFSNRRLSTKRDDAVLRLPSDVIGFFISFFVSVVDLHFVLIVLELGASFAIMLDSCWML